MLNRRGFVKLLVGAAAGLLTGKAGAVEAAQPEIGLAETRGHCNLQLQIHRQACIENVRVYDYALSGAEVIQRYLELISDSPPTEGLVVWRTDGSPMCWYPSSPPKCKCDICGRPAPYHWDDDLHWCPLHTDTVWRSSGGPADWTIRYEDQ